MLEEIKKHLEQYAQTGHKNLTLLAHIAAMMMYIPLFGWGGFHTSDDGEESHTYLAAIPVQRDADVCCTVDYLHDCSQLDKSQLQIPLFTSEEEAVKGGTNLSAFVYDYALPLFSLIMPMEMDVVIDPFSEHAAVIPKAVLKMVWKRIREFNDTTGCPDPDWKMRSIMP